MILTFNSLVHLSFVMNKYAAFLNEIMHKMFHSLRKFINDVDA